MAQDTQPPAHDEMDYAAIEQDALRGVVKMALKRAATPPGLPGAHHFRITFRTRAPGVSMPRDLLAQYPEEMTIALQHQFWDLAPGETFFAVTLKFNGQAKPLSIPYAAVSRFYDPSVGYLLQFDPPSEPAAEPEPVPPAEVEADASALAEPAAPDGQDKGETKIVSLDQFRKK
jgi:hypothetical protein